MVGYSRTKSLTLLGGVLAALLGAPLVPVLIQRIHVPLSFSGTPPP